MKLREKLLHLNRNSQVRKYGAGNIKRMQAFQGVTNWISANAEKKVDIIWDIQHECGYQMLEITFLSTGQNPSEMQSLG